MIKQLQINNFRNYRNATIDLNDNKNIVVLYGENGEGKTNILEAISLFSETKGLRKANYEDMINKNNSENYWSIILKTKDEEFTSAYLRGEKSGKRIYKINDKACRNLSEFQKDSYVIWMTYETDRLFLQSPSNRRDFIDMFCSVRSHFHRDNVIDYEKLTRERLKILKKYCENGITNDISKWLDIIEEKIADLGLKIAIERMKITKELEDDQLTDNNFPGFKNEMTGGLESCIISKEPVYQLEFYKSELRNRRQKDGFSGSTTLGPNRSDWKVFHVEKKVDANLCSAGEQKMLLSGVFLSFIVRNLKNDKRNLILLLDDVIAHLDLPHRNLFFRYIKNLVEKNFKNVMVWLSGTDKELFCELKEQAEFFHIHNNFVEKG